MHLKPVSNSFKRELFLKMYEEHPEYRKRRDYSRSWSRKRSKKDKSKKERRSRSRSRSRRSRSGGKRNAHKKSKSRSANRDLNSVERRAMIAQWNN